MRALGRVLRLAGEGGVVVLLPRGQLEDGLGSDAATVGQFLGQVLAGEHGPETVDPGDLGGRLAALTDALELDLAVFRGHQVVALHDLRRLRRHQDGQPGEMAPDPGLTLRTRGHLALVAGVVVQHHREYVQRVVA